VTAAAVGAFALLLRVDAATDRCADRVVFAFTSEDGEPPGYTVSYAAPPFVADGSGAPVVVRGTAFVAVRLAPASGFDFERERPSYTGPNRFTPTGARHVTEVVRTGDFEGVLNWVIGLDTRRPFAVAAAGAPRNEIVITVG
jgi:hypothetical protein